MKKRLVTRKYLKNKAEKELWNRELEDIGTVDEFVNVNCYVSMQDLSNIIKWIVEEYWNSDRTELDTWFVYWEEIIDYLTAIVSTYLYNYIMENMEKRGSKLRNDI